MYQALAKNIKSTWLNICAWRLRSEGGQNKKVTVIHIDKADHGNTCEQDCTGDLISGTRLMDHVDQAQAEH